VRLEVHNLREDALTIIQPLVSIAEKEGADEVELFALSRNEKKVNYETSSLKSASATRVEGVGIRVLANKSLGFASANSFDKSRILDALKDAISIAKITPPMDHYYLSTPQKIRMIKDLYNADTANLTMSETIDCGKDLLKHIFDADSRVSVESGQVISSVDEYAIATSTGIESSEKRTALSWYVLGWAVDGSDIGSFDIAFDSTVSVSDMDFESGAKMFAQKVLQNLGAEKSDAFKGTAIFSHDAAIDLFQMLTTSTKSTTIQSGSSFLQDKLGESIAVPDLTITDNGSAPRIATNSSFDREGVPHAPLDIIDKGVFKAVLYNTFTANKDELSSTGHASGGFRSAPDIGTTYTEIQRGTISYDEMLSEVDRGIYIQRVSMDPDYTSGDFSAVLKGGQLIENGEFKMTLKEMTVTGNLFDALQNITGISKEQKHLRGFTTSWLVPYIRIENLDFAS
jgi:PmbA protein